MNDTRFCSASRSAADSGTVVITLEPPAMNATQLISDNDGTGLQHIPLFNRFCRIAAMYAAVSPVAAAFDSALIVSNNAGEPIGGGAAVFSSIVLSSQIH